MKFETTQSVNWLLPALYLALLLWAVTAWLPELLTFFSPDKSVAFQGLVAACTIFVVPIGFWLKKIRRQSDQPPPSTPVSHRQLQEFYYNNLLKECERYDLGDLDEEQAEDDSGLSLSDVYVDQYVTVFDPKEKAASSDREELIERKAVPLFQALEEYFDRHCIISGIVGSGKSSFVNFLAAHIIRSSDSRPSSVLPEKFCRRAVVRIRLRRIGAAIDATTDANGLLLRHIREQVRGHIVSGCKGQSGVCDVPDRDIDLYCDELVKKLHKCGVLLLDGLDEITLAENKREIVQQAVQNFIDHLPENSSCQLVLTSRPPGLLDNRDRRYLPPGFVRFELQDMSLKQAGSFIRHWYQKKAMDSRLDGEDQENQKRADQLTTQIGERPSLIELTGTPMLLTLMLLVDSGNYRLPESRAALYDRAVKLLLQRWHRNLSKEMDSLGPEDQVVLKAMVRSGFTTELRESLAGIALESYQDAEDGGVDENENITFRQSMVLGQINQTFGQEIDSVAVRNFLENRSNILVGAGEGDDRLQFIHKSFHEFLAAESYHFDDDSRTTVNALLNDPKKRDWWREVLLFWMNARSIVELKDFIRPLLLEQTETMEKDRLNNHAGSVVLCCEAAVEKNLQRYADTGKRDQGLNQLFEEAQRKLLELMQDERVVVTVRAEAGRLLGELGDPRPGVTVCRENRWLPDIDWVKIPAVSGFMMGTDDKDARKDEKPAHPVDMDSFCISRCPITNAQYRCFIEAGGYTSLKYWQTEAARHWLAGGTADEGLIETVPRAYREEYRQWLLQDTVERNMPRYWNDRLWNNPNHPVVGVCWFEAIAFCCWLAEVEGKPIRLPGEEEWEYAARGVKGLKYAWGEKFDRELGNTGETGFERTTAVGLFAPGKAVGSNPEAVAFGLYDMSGNVLEWTANRWGREWGRSEFTYAGWNKYIRGERENQYVNEFRVLRGCSWYIDPAPTRCSHRHKGIPEGRDYYRGFRVVFSPAAVS